jgi:hypothetical protein
MKHRDIEIEILKEKRKDSREPNHTGNSPTLRLSQSRYIPAHLTDNLFIDRDLCFVKEDAIETTAEYIQYPSAGR